jgi:hypothetical protein
METHLLRRQAVNLAFGHGEPLEDRHRLLFHPVGELARRDQLPDLSKVAAMFMRVGVAVRVSVAMLVRGRARAAGPRGHARSARCTSNFTPSRLALCPRLTCR